MTTEEKVYKQLTDHLHIVFNALGNHFNYKHAYDDVDEYIDAPYANDKNLDTLQVLRTDCDLVIMTIEKIEQYKFEICSFDKDGSTVVIRKTVSTLRDFAELSEEMKKFITMWQKEKSN